MKVALLTSDILDGKVVLSRLLEDGKNICAVIYERKPQTVKMYLKTVYFFLRGNVRFVRYEHLRRRYRNMVVMAVTNINQNEVVGALESVGPDLIAVVGTRKLKAQIYNLAKKSLNMHTGMLPFYRGADSEYWALYNGELQRIGVTIHTLGETLDGGDIILQRQSRVFPQDSYRTLRNRNMREGAILLSDAITAVANGQYASCEQDDSLSTTYTSVNYTPSPRSFDGKASEKHKVITKEFGSGACRVRERVAHYPSSAARTHVRIVPKAFIDTFCLRIDADECHDNIGEYLKLFMKYRDCTTIFFCMRAFSQKQDILQQAHGAGCDIQSHGFHHHTYNDFTSNRYNIHRAKEALRVCGIETHGYSAPMGKYRASLMCALEEEGYEYSSDFSFDYLGFARYPAVGKRFSRILQIPVFPVCPELFLQKGINTPTIIDYYKRAIIEMRRCNIPVIIYGHTSHFRENCALLEEIVEFARGELALKPQTMSGLSRHWKMACNDSGVGELVKVKVGLMQEDFLGRPVQETFSARVKTFIKDAIDFERTTPAKEMQGSFLRRGSKLFLRRICHG